MKTLRIMNDGSSSYVERQFFRRWWFRVSPKYSTNIQAYNWARRQKDSELIRRR